jgi:hypothetical protein
LGEYELYCPNCGREIAGDVSFCNFCGQGVSSHTQSPQAPTHPVLRTSNLREFLWNRWYLEGIILGVPLLLAVLGWWWLTSNGSVLPFVGLLVLFALPEVVGISLRRAIEAGIGSFGADHPSRFLLKVRSADRTKYVAMAIVVVSSLVITLSVAFASSASPASSSGDIFTYLAVVFIVYTLALMLLIFPLLLPYKKPIPFAKLHLNSALDEERKFPQADHAIDYFNRHLRSKRWPLRIKEDISLEAKLIFLQKEERQSAITNLVGSLDEDNPKAFVDGVAKLLDKTPDSILERAKGFKPSEIVSFLFIISAIASCYPIIFLAMGKPP